MEQEALLCAKFIMEIYKDGYYVDSDVLTAAKTILNDWASENDCIIDGCDEDWSELIPT